MLAGFEHGRNADFIAYFWHAVKNIRYKQLKDIYWAGETAQWLRALAALPEDPGTVPRTHVAILQLSVTPGSDALM